MSGNLAALRRACLVLGLLLAVSGAVWAQCPAPVIGPTIDFGSQPVFTTSAPRVHTETCGTGATCTGLSATLLGPDAAAFMVTNGCNTPTFTGTCDISITFTPARCGPHVAFLVLTRNSPTASCPAGSVFRIITLTGVGVANPPAVVGPPLTFPSTLAGTTGGCITLTVPANTSVSEIGPNFTITATNCPQPASTCTVTVCFMPPAAGCGTLGGTLVLTSTLTGCPVATFALSGFACSFECAIGQAGTASLTAAGRQCILGSLGVASTTTGLTRCAALRCAECCAESDLALRAPGSAARASIQALLDQIRCLQAFFGCAPFPC